MTLLGNFFFRDIIYKAQQQFLEPGGSSHLEPKDTPRANSLTNNGLRGWKAPVHLSAPCHSKATRLGARFECVRLRLPTGKHQILPPSCHPDPPGVR